MELHREDILYEKSSGKHLLSIIHMLLPDTLHIFFTETIPVPPLVFTNNWGRISVSWLYSPQNAKGSHMIECYMVL